MKLFKKALKSTLILSVVAFSIIACDKDFASIDSDIINEETATNFNTTSEQYNVISYTDALGPVQTNGLPVGMLGVYNDPTYGRTSASIVTQVNTSLLNPTFGEGIILDSVVITIPYFSSNIGLNEDNAINYQLDSIIPRSDNYKPIKLSVFENNYFLRNFDPTTDFDTPQSYFSDKSASNSEQINNADLEGRLIHEIDVLEISNKGIILTDGNETEATVTQRLPPAIRLAYKNNIPENAADIAYWQEKILSQEGNTTLSNSNNFNNYFRGLYFKAEPLDEDGSLILFNLAQEIANVTLYYTRDSSTIDGETEQATYTLTFGPNRVNFFDNTFTQTISDGDDQEGDSRLYLKGGEGSIAKIKLFDGQNEDEDENTDNTFEAWRKQFVNLDEEGNFESSKRLVNEAFLVFYVDQDALNGQEPERIFLYNNSNNFPLTDYFLDIQNNTLPRLSIPNHLGVLQKDETTEAGIKYKIKITSHINDLLINNTENVELGLAVSGNVNLEGTFSQAIVQTLDNTEIRVPISSLITPRGTILHGNKSTTKPLFLEVIYTCLETDIDCPENN